MNAKIKVTVGCGIALMISSALWWITQDAQQKATDEIPRTISKPVQESRELRTSVHQSVASSSSESVPVSQSVSPAKHQPASTPVSKHVAPALQNNRPHKALSASPQSKQVASTAHPAYQVIRQAQQNGMRLPAPLMRLGMDNSNFSPQQQAVLNSLQEEFLEMIGPAAAMAPSPKDGSTAAPLPEEWEEARQWVDSRFRLFFGDEAYNYMSMEAAIDSNSP